MRLVPAVSSTGWPSTATEFTISTGNGPRPSDFAICSRPMQHWPGATLRLFFAQRRGPVFVFVQGRLAFGLSMPQAPSGHSSDPPARDGCLPTPRRPPPPLGVPREARAVFVWRKPARPGSPHPVLFPDPDQSGNEAANRRGRFGAARSRCGPRRTARAGLDDPDGPATHSCRR